MPIYEYRCQECGHELEKLQRMGDAPLSDCPACEQPGLRRLISAAGFRLKGGGWYETDFKHGQKRNLADGGGEATKDGNKGATAEGSQGQGEKASPKKGGAQAGGEPKAAPAVSDT
jgi:putative FmdB family regulatory protein